MYLKLIPRKIHGLTLGTKSYANLNMFIHIPLHNAGTWLFTCVGPKANGMASVCANEHMHTANIQYVLYKPLA